MRTRDGRGTEVPAGRRILEPGPTTWPLATSPEEAAQVAENIGYPVVLKVLSADLPHKSDIGGVIVGLDDADAVSQAYIKMMQELQTHSPKSAIEGV